MRITMNCRYCGKEFSFTYKDELKAPARAFVKVNCPSCNSRHAIDLAVRSAGKSAKIKKDEKAREADLEKRTRARYEDTADSVVKPWSSLTPSEKHLQTQRTVWLDRGYKPNW